MGFALHGADLTLPLNREDSCWIRGEILGSPLRLTPHLLLHRLLLPVFGDRFVVYRLVLVLVHIICAALVYLLFWQLARGVTAAEEGAGSAAAEDSGGGPPASARAGWLCTHLGAALAGGLFLLYDCRILEHVDALSYQLVTLFGLLTVWAGVASLNHQRAVYWVLCCGAYLGALFSHSFSLTLPFWLALWEAAQARCGARPTTTWRSVLLRYGALAMLSGGFVILGFGKILQRVVGGLEQQNLNLTFLLQAPHYLQFLVLQYVTPEDSYPTMVGWPEALWLGLIGLAIVSAAWVMVRRWQRGLGWVALVMTGLVWPLMAYPYFITLGFYRHPFRFYFPAVGLCLAAAMALLLIVRTLAFRARWGAPRRWSRWAGPLALAAAAVGIYVGLVPLNSKLGRHLKASIQGQQEWEMPRVWSPTTACTSLTRADRHEVIVSYRTGVSLRCLDLRGVDLSGLDLRGADLTGTNLTAASLEWTSLQGATLEDACLLWVWAPGVDLRDAVLQRAVLMGASMRRANLARADLRNASLRWADLLDADLRQANLRGADLSEVDLNFVDLSGADARGANFNRTDLRQAKVTGADFRGARMPDPSLGIVRRPGAVLNPGQR